MKRTLLVTCVLMICGSVVGQNPRGSLRGVVQDSTGARISSAKVVLQASNASMRREAVSAERGEFRVDDLPPGDYQVSVNATGFREAQANVSVAVSSVREVTVTLKPAAPGEAVNVRGESSSITTQPIDLASV